MANENQMKDKLTEFLVDAPPPPAPLAPLPPLEPEIPAATIVVTAVEPLENPIFTVITDLKCIGMCAKDLHYRAFGTPFYGLHMLADLIWEVEHETDDLIEAYYMGENRSDPPMMDKIYEKAIKCIPFVVADKDMYIRRLMNVCHRTIDDVEAAKALPNLKAGVQAILDNISQKTLVSVGLLSQTLKSE